MEPQKRNTPPLPGNRGLVAIADAKSYYCYYHLYTRPELRGWPIVVLSNNDGMVIALNDEAKAIGLVRGSVWHMQTEEMKAKCAVFSSKYTGYLGLIIRVKLIIAALVPMLESYSIDEMWADMNGLTNVRELVPHIIEKVYRITGIVLRIGVAPTKSLAKIAQRIAKQRPEGYCILETDEEIAEALADYPVAEMWNVGAAYANKLQMHGILTAGRLRITPEWWIKKHMTINGVRLVKELWGESCLAIEEFIDPKKHIGVGRSFSKANNDPVELLAAANFYSQILVDKLRQEKVVATVFMVKLHTNRHALDRVQHNPTRIFNLKTGINNVLDVSELARQAITSMLNEKKGALYMKIELYAAKLIPENENQLIIGSSSQSAEKNRLTLAMEDLNQRWGKGTVCFANTVNAYERNLNHNEKPTEAYMVRMQYPSPNYLTNWNESFIAC